MSYQVFILPRAHRQLAGLPCDAEEAVLEELRGFTGTPRPHGCKKLTGREGWRIRIGHYRVVYEIDDRQRTVTVLDIAHRKDVYR